jgi:uncharacterized protein (DUF924 family)
VILLDQFPRNMYLDAAQMYACDAHSRALVRRRLRIGVSGRLAPIERVFLCLVLTHSEILDDLAPVHAGVGPGDGHARAG